MALPPSSDMPREKVRVVYMDGPQVYGRTAADDAGFEAAFLAKELGRPVRMQWMRDEETAWDTEGPALCVQAARRAGCSRAKLTALEYDACAADHSHLGYNEPDTVLIAQLMGRRPERARDGHAAEAPSMMYAIPQPAHHRTRVVACRCCGKHRCAPATCAIPNGPQVTLRVRRSFIDELAAAAGKADPAAVPPAIWSKPREEDNVFRKARSLAALRGRCRIPMAWDIAPRAATAAARGAVQHRTRHRLHLSRQHHCLRSSPRSR